MRLPLGFALVLCLTTSGRCAADMTLDLSTARLTLDARGMVVALRFADGETWPGSHRPVFSLETDDGVRQPTAVTLDGNRLTVAFERDAKAEFSIARDRGLVVFRLEKLAAAEAVKRFHLFSLPMPEKAELDGTLNAAFSTLNAAAVMAAEPNVHALSDRFGGHRSDRPGCKHEFARCTDGAKVGRAAAQFTATSDPKPGGWSMSGRAFPTPMDLSGCQAIRAWVHGDGKGQMLKIQLTDSGGGARDDYIKIDFTGWRQLTLPKPQFNTLRYDRVTALNFYYNSLPPGQTVTCLVDQVEAILARPAGQQVVLLEDFESADSPLWQPSQRTLRVETLRRYGLQPASFGVLAGPRGEFLKTVERFELAAGLPSPRPGGAWNKVSPLVKRSYFFLTSFKESEFDEALAIAKRGGFDTILLGQESWCHSTGHYEINAKRFPDGLEGLKRTIQRFQAAGFHFGLHFLGPSIYPPDPYLTPVPDPRLVKDATIALAADVDAKADFIPAPQAPDAFPAEDGGYDGPGTVLQVGDELIWYGQRSMKAPYGFCECRRGYLGTKAAAHKKGDVASHLLKSYGYFLFDMDTSLLDEAATNFAKVANACDIDMIYFDGSERLQGDHWYYNARLHKTFYDKLRNKNMLLQASSFSHYSWHILARTASADGHDDLKAYLDERSPWFPTLARNGLPLDIGWYYGYDPSASLDMFEYILGATIGYDSSMSFQVSVSAAARHPFTPQILDLIARYEKLRLSGRTPQAMRDRLRIDPALGGKKEPDQRDKLLELRRDYRLLDENGRQAFQRVHYGLWRPVTAVDGKGNVWPVKIAQEGGRIGLEIHAQKGHWLSPGPSYRADDALLLESFDDLGPYLRKPRAGPVVRAVEPGEGGSVLPGVVQRLELAEGGPEGKHYAVYSADTHVAGRGGWSAIGRQFATPTDISWHKAIGFWLRGDGQGGQFKLQLRDGVGAGAVDYYITNNFTGWRYQQLARPQVDAIDYAKLRSLTLYYNGLPGKTRVSCGIDDIKALRRLDPQELVDPWVELDGRRWTWKGTLGEGQYLVFWPGEPIARYGLPLKEVELGSSQAPDATLPAGSYTAKFGCRGELSMPLRVRVTVQPKERYEIP